MSTSDMSRLQLGIAPDSWGVRFPGGPEAGDVAAVPG